MSRTENVLLFALHELEAEYDLYEMVSELYGHELDHLEKVVAAVGREVKKVRFEREWKKNPGLT